MFPFGMKEEDYVQFELSQEKDNLNILEILADSNDIMLDFLEK